MHLSHQFEARLGGHSLSIANGVLTVAPLDSVGVKGLDLPDERRALQIPASNDEVRRLAHALLYFADSMRA